MGGGGGEVVRGSSNQLIFSKSREGGVLCYPLRWNKSYYQCTTTTFALLRLQDMILSCGTLTPKLSSSHIKNRAKVYM